MPPTGASTVALPPLLATVPSVMPPAAARTRTSPLPPSTAAGPGLVIAPPVSTVMPPCVPLAVRLPPTVTPMVPAVVASAVIAAWASASPLGPATSTMPRSVAVAVVAVTTA